MNKNDLVVGEKYNHKAQMRPYEFVGQTKDGLFVFSYDTGDLRTGPMTLYATDNDLSIFIKTKKTHKVIVELPIGLADIPNNEKNFYYPDLHEGYEEMTELLILKERIRRAGYRGVKTADIREDYEPIGGRMIRDLTLTGEYKTVKVLTSTYSYEWKIFLKEFSPE